MPRPSTPAPDILEAIYDRAGYVDPDGRTCCPACYALNPEPRRQRLAAPRGPCAVCGAELATFEPGDLVRVARRGTLPIGHRGTLLRVECGRAYVEIERDDRNLYGWTEVGQIVRVR